MAAKTTAARKATRKPSSSKSKMPDFVPPCLATLVDAPPVGDEWVHEIKFDGYRVQAHIHGSDVKLLTRNGLDWTARFGNLPQLLAAFHKGSAILDGELVVEDVSGRSSFSALADALGNERSERFVFYCFDVLYLDGDSLVNAPLVERKSALQKLFARRSKSGQIRYSEHLIADGARMLSDACGLGLEGIISKRADRPYHSGRNGDWLKSKCVQVDEFVIIGYLVSAASPNAIGALVVGYYDRKRLVYAGRVGTGYTQRVAADLMKRLKPLKTDDMPIRTALTNLQRRDVIWVEPKLVAQITYRAWTGDGLLRHASFKGLREDKPAADVRRPKTATKSNGH
jgi:bifunctional non-homologous end joining protein LigD